MRRYSGCFLLLLCNHEHWHNRPAARGSTCATPQQATEQSAQAATQTTAGVLRLRRVALLGHVAGHQHRQDRQHLLEQGRVETGPRRRVLRHCATHVLRAEDLAEHGIAESHIGGLRAEYAVEQAPTAELAQLVANTVKTREPGQNPATRTFQAFRIFINAELEELQQALEASLDVLQPGGRLVVISFHSLEDRIVKQFIAQHSREVYDRRAPFAPPQIMKLKALDRVKPGAAEVAGNPRSRSAIMRVAQRTAA